MLSRRVRTSPRTAQLARASSPPYRHRSSPSVVSKPKPTSAKKTLSVPPPPTKAEAVEYIATPMTTVPSAVDEATQLLDAAKNTNSKSSGEEAHVFGPLLGFQTLNQVINWHKVTSLAVMVGACAVAGSTNLASLMYTAMHGAYGLIWCMKYQISPDKSFEDKIGTKVDFFVSWLILGALYWSGGLMTILTKGTNVVGGLTLGLPATNAAIQSGTYGVQLAVAVFLFTIGMYMHFVADAHKYFVLKERKGLITDGLFARTRNPNYLGEMIIYTGFALCANNIVLVASNLLMWSTLFRVNMLKKDKSLSRHKDFDEYQKRTNLLLPRLFASST